MNRKHMSVLISAFFIISLVAAIQLVSADVKEKEVCANSDVVLVIDRSGSMSGQAISDAKAAAKNFVDLLNLGGGDQGASASFASSASLDIGLTANSAAIKAAIDGISASGATCIACGIDIAQGELDANGRSDTNHVIILLSDGYPNSGNAGASASAAKGKGTIIFTIGISGADQSLMESLASDPSYFQFGSSADLGEIYTTIANQVCQLPPPPEGGDVPEFSVIASVFVLGAAGLYLFKKRD